MAIGRRRRAALPATEVTAASPHTKETINAGSSITSAGASVGSRLGLAIVRHVAEQHGGDVRARNLDGGGAEVGFSVA